MLDDREGAVREVAKVYELIKTHQPLLFLHHHQQGQPQEPPLAAATDKHKLAQSLLSEALRGLNIALSFMKQEQQESSSSTTAASPLAVKAERQHSPRGAKRRRSSAVEGKNSSSWVHLTTVPYEDGFEWRKYGEKRINGTQFTRSYFRCTYKDDKGCLATKYVQQKDDNSDPPVFQVTYNNEHTCNCMAATTSLAKDSSSPHPPIGHQHDAQLRIEMNIKQEEAATTLQPHLAVAADLSAFQLLDHHQVPCQEPVPMAADLQYGTAGDADQHAVIPSSSTSSSAGGSCCVSPESSDDRLDMEPIMAELLMGDNDHDLQDLEVLLLCKSFKYY